MYQLSCSSSHLLPLLGSWNRSLMPSIGGSIRVPSSTAESANVCFPSVQLYLWGKQNYFLSSHEEVATGKH